MIKDVIRRYFRRRLAPRKEQGTGSGWEWNGSRPGREAAGARGARGAAAVFAAEEFFHGRIRNPHTRTAYKRAVRKFLEWCDERGLELHTITPKHVGEYVDGLGSIAKEHQHLAALRHFFDVQVERHAVILNPALSVRGQRYEVVEGKTPEIPVQDARDLLASIDTSNVVRLRDRAALAVLAYTAVRVGALAKLTRGNVTHDGSQWCLRFQEKGGKSHEGKGAIDCASRLKLNSVRI